MAAPGIVTSGTGPPNAVVQVQPGMQVQPVVLVDANGNYVTTSGSTATAGYLADLTGSVNVSQAAAPAAGQVLTATSGTTATWQSGSAETAGYLATTGASVYVAGGSAPTTGMELIATSGSAATWQFGASGILTTLGDMLFENSTPALARLAGNTSATKMFLTQTGNGTVSANPAWGTIAAADVPVLNQNTTGTAAAASVANALAVSGGSVSVSAASAPSANQALFATSGTTATWQTAPVAGGGTGGTTATLARANLGVAAGSVSTQTLGGTTASITFTAIPGTYNQLRLAVIGASTKASEVDQWAVTVNGDSGAHYDTQGITGQHTTLAGGIVAADNFWAVGENDVPGTSATPGVAGVLEIVIPAYAGTTFQKAGLWRSGYVDAVASSSDGAVAHAAISWRSGSAITSITVALASGDSLVTGTTASLYLT